ncbi:MAG: 30S ribosomal protein S15 [Deltaproteobacteria bacterium]|nr:30S ribosomal protein S15 [Deltaproteobacteria bacterium]
MALHKTKTAEIIALHARGEGDTGSPEVQVALLTARIEHLDHGALQHPPQGLPLQAGSAQLVGQRRRLLRYLKANDEGRYQALIAKLGLRR